MNKVKEFFKKVWKWIGTDGLLHFFVCFGMTAILTHYVNIGLAVAIPVFVGFAKEILWDGWLQKGQFQWKDILFDLLGVAVAVLLLLPEILA